jgi:hypothetical protein
MDSEMCRMLRLLYSCTVTIPDDAMAKVSA